jgi:hypothetical protein
MEFAAPKWGNCLIIFRANDSCWRFTCVDRSFIMLGNIWVSLRLEIGCAARFWPRHSATQRFPRRDADHKRNGLFKTGLSPSSQVGASRSWSFSKKNPENDRRLHV